MRKILGFLVLTSALTSVSFAQSCGSSWQFDYSEFARGDIVGDEVTSAFAGSVIIGDEVSSQFEGSKIITRDRFLSIY